ncbi:MAG: T9SS type A sorting domain-containing protein [Calditrichaeota bacterium]|nr:T9SS type A sorting domain-containing protein [Calditrichota bacterium]
MTHKISFTFGKIYISFLFLYFIPTAYSQPAQPVQKHYKALFQSEEKYYQKLIQCETQITQNQMTYDVNYYMLSLSPDFMTDTLFGTVKINATVTGQSINNMELNFWENMIITDIHLVQVPGVQLNYTFQNNILTIELDRLYNQGEQISLIISYCGRPQDAPLSILAYGYSTYLGKIMIATLSEPFSARTWWPCKDIPSDKADSMDIKVTVPNEYIVASNGNLREKVTVGDFTTYWWHEQYPISTYLVSLAIYPYEVHYDNYVYNNGTDTMKIYFYSFPGNYMPIHRKVKDMITCFSRLFGEYPFIAEKYGQADCYFQGASGAMEHQTCSSFWGTSMLNEITIAHELAHQWWGDLITCKSFHHIWLNEGFATYCETLWLEHIYNLAYAINYQMGKRYYGPGTIFVEDPLNEPIFDHDLSYNKGSWVLHMLRYVTGDSVFFNILKSYYTSPLHQYGTATTEDFQSICEQVSGMNLQKYFQQWIYGEHYPSYIYGWTVQKVANQYNTTLFIDQGQTNTGIFWMPIDVLVITDSDSERFVVWDSLQSQSFHLLTSDEPNQILLDPDNWILQTNTVKTIYPNVQNTTVNKNYLIPETDTLWLRTDLVNPDNHQVNIKSVMKSFDNSIADTIQLFDDGMHCDSSAGDGLYGGSWSAPVGEKSYRVQIYTFSLDSGYYTIQSETPGVTTIGPLVFDDYQIQQITKLSAGYRAHVYISIRNEGLSSAAEDVDMELLCDDTTVISIGNARQHFGDILPGEAVFSPNAYYVRTNNNPLIDTINFSLNIHSHRTLYWQDSTMTMIVGMQDFKSTIPKDYAFHQNYPNPFNPSTTIKFDLPKTSKVSLKIFNIIGEEVATLVSDRLSAGSYSYDWDASNLASGVYLYRLQAGDYVETKKMILMR